MYTPKRGEEGAARQKCKTRPTFAHPPIPTHSTNLHGVGSYRGATGAESFVEILSIIHVDGLLILMFTTCSIWEMWWSPVWCMRAQCACQGNGRGRTKTLTKDRKHTYECRKVSVRRLKSKALIHKKKLASHVQKKHLLHMSVRGYFCEASYPPRAPIVS